MPNNTPTSLLTTLGEGLLVFIFTTLFVSTLWVNFFGELTWVASAFSATTAGIATTAWNIKRFSNISMAALTVAISVFALAITGLIAQSIFDTSYDGQNYHMSAILGLMEGWRPLLQNEPTAPELHSIWVDTYPKSAWIIQATWSQLTSLEASKNLNLIAILSATLLTIGTLTQLGFSRAWSTFLGLLAGLNPISMVQWPTFYNDGLVASLFTIMVVSATLASLKGNRGALIIFLMSAIIVAGLKFSTLVLGVAFVFFGLLAFFIRQKEHRPFLGWLTLLSLVVATVVLWEPYATNFLQNQHPFYPLMGENARDIMNGNKPEALLNIPLPIQWLVGLTNISHGLGDWTQIQKSYMYAGVYDQRFGGFGPLMGAIFALTILLVFFMSQKTHHKGVQTAAAVVGVILVTFAIHPEGWWARYVPQMWLLPLVVAAAAISVSKAKSITRGIATLLLIIVALNTIGMTTAGHTLAKERHQEVENDISILLKKGTHVHTTSGSQFGASWRRLEEQGMTVDIAPLHCEHPLSLSYSGGRKFCHTP